MNSSHRRGYFANSHCGWPSESELFEAVLSTGDFADLEISQTDSYTIKTEAALSLFQFYLMLL